MRYFGRGLRHSARPRRNPAQQATTSPMVVLVRRFDPTGETLSRWEALYRDARGVRFSSPPAAKRAALHPPPKADLHVGDLIATMPAEAAGYDEYATGLYVVAPDGVKAAPKPPEELDGPWLTRWGQDAEGMFGASSAVDRRRLVMAACDCAETVLHLVPAGEERPRKAIETARAWCFALVGLEAVRAADVAVSASAYELASLAADAASSASGAVTALNPYLFAGDAARYAADAKGSRATALREFAPLVERWIPLPVVLLSTLGYPDAIPFDPSTVPAPSAGPRENPRRRRRVQ